MDDSEMEVNEGMVLVRVLQFTDDGCVYITTSSLSDLMKIEEDAMMVAESSLKNNVKDHHPLPPKRGEVCLVNVYDKWHRGDMKKAFVSVRHGTLAEVFLIDHGRNCNAPINKLIKLHDWCPLAVTPPLAISVPLSVSHVAVTPDSISQPWHEAVSCVFNNLLGDDVYVDNVWGQSVYSTRNDHSIQLFHKNSNGNMVSFNSILIKSGFLVPAVNTNTGSDTSSFDTPKHQEHQYKSFILSASDSPTSADTPTKSPSYLNRSLDLELAVPQNHCHQSIAVPSLKRYLPPRPKKYHGVFVEGVSDEVVWNELNETPFPSSVCQSLKERGFRYPTAVQAHSWPYIWNNRDTVLLSPTNSGKTLGYLLPLLCLKEMKESLHEGRVESYEPRIIVLVSESYKAWLINEQITTIFSWINAALRFRSCGLYFTVESESLSRILNGTDVIVATPPSLLRLIDSKILTLNRLHHLVLDDVLSLHKHFTDNVDQIMEFYRAVTIRRQARGLSDLGRHVVVCLSKYIPSPWKWIHQYLSHPVTVVSSSMDLIALKGLKCRVICTSFPSHVICMMIKDRKSLKGASPLVVCVRTEHDATNLIQILSVSSFNAFEWCRGSLPLNEGDVAVVKDDDLLSIIDINDTVINHLVHYLLPEAKITFNKRHALLVPSLKSNTNPSVMILINDTCTEQSRDLVDLMERLGQPAPDDLRKLAENKQKAQLKKQKLYSLCNYIKGYGVCLSTQNCNMAHNVNELVNRLSVLPKPCLPADGVVKVKVEHVTSPVQIWVKIIDHTPFKRGTCPSVSNSLISLTQMSLDLAIHYSSPAHCKPHRNPKRGDICGLREPTGECYRVRILDFSAPLGLYFHHKEKAKVHLVDKGETFVVDANQLLELPDKFMATPPLVIEAYICGLRPLDNDIDWPPESVSIALRLFQGRILIGRVASSHDNTIWLDPVEERVTLGGLNINTALFVPQRKLVEERLACGNSGHLSGVRKALNKTEDEKYLKYDKCRKISVLDIGRSKVTLTAVDSSSCVFVQQVTAEPILESISERLSRSHPVIKGFDDFLRSRRFKTGELCAALFPHDKKWYRVCIKDVREMCSSPSDESESDTEFFFNSTSPADLEYLCFFVDYGDFEWVKAMNIQSICQELLEYPLQAVECKLCSNNAGPDEDEFIGRLWDRTRNRKLHVKMISKGSPECGVSLMTEDDQDVLNLCRSEHSNTVSTDEELDSDNASHSVTSETTTILILIRQGQVPNNQFLYHVISNHGKIVLLKKDIELLSILIKQCDLHQDVIKGILLLLVTRPQYINTFGKHLDFCKALTQILKNPASKDALLSALQLVNLLFAENTSPLFDVPDVINILINITSSNTGMGKLISLSLNTMVFLMQSQKLSEAIYCTITDKLGLHLAQLLQREHLVLCCVRFMCLLIARSISFDVIIEQFESITRDAKTWPMEGREWLIQSAVLSSNSDIKKCLIRLYKRFMAEGIEISSIEKALFDFIQDQTCADACDSLSQGKKSTWADHKGSHYSNGIVPVHPSISNINILTPKVLWSQTRSILCLSVQIRGCERERVTCNDHRTVSFKSYQVTNRESMYSFTLTLFGNIKEDKYIVSVKGGEVIIKLIKEQEMYWPRVSRSKNKPSFVAVDYSRWKEESSSSDSEKGNRKIWSKPTYVPKVSKERESDNDSEDSVIYDDLEYEEHLI